MAGVSALIRDGGQVGGGGNLAVLTFVLLLEFLDEHVPRGPAPAGAGSNCRSWEPHFTYRHTRPQPARTSRRRGRARAATGADSRAAPPGVRPRRHRCGCRARTARRSVNRGEGARRRGQRPRRQSRRSSRRGRGRRAGQVSRIEILAAANRDQVVSGWPAGGLVARCAGSVLESGPAPRRAGQVRTRRQRRGLRCRWHTSPRGMTESSGSCGVSRALPPSRKRPDVGPRPSTARPGTRSGPPFKARSAKSGPS